MAPPSTAPKSTVSTTATAAGMTLPSIILPRNTPHKAAMAPADRSNPPLMSTNVMPIETMNSTEIEARMFWRFSPVRNPGCHTAKSAKRMITTAITGRNGRVPPHALDKACFTAPPFVSL